MPIFAALNVVYALLRLGSFTSSTATVTIWSYLGVVTCLGLNIMCYISILDDAATNHSNHNSKDLVGGMWLDVWMLTVVVQFGTAIMSQKFYYLLLILPPWGLYKIYSSFRGMADGFSGDGTAGQQQDQGAPSGEVDAKTAEKRKKRAERRRQKWT